MVGAQLCIENSGPITLISRELSRHILIKCSHVHLVDRKTYDARVIRDDLVLRNKVATIDAPADPTRDSRDRVHYSRLVVERSLFRTHLISQEARESWLIDARIGVLELNI